MDSVRRLSGLARYFLLELTAREDAAQTTEVVRVRSRFKLARRDALAPVRSHDRPLRGSA